MSLLQFDCAGLFLFFLSLSLCCSLSFSVFLASLIKRVVRKKKKKEKSKGRRERKEYPTNTHEFGLRHAWLSPWGKHMTTGRINQVSSFSFIHILNALLFPSFYSIVCEPSVIATNYNPLFYSSLTHSFCIELPLLSCFLFVSCVLPLSPNKPHHPSLFNCFVFVSQFLLLLCSLKRSTSLYAQ